MFKLNASSTRGCSVTQKTWFRLTYSPVNVTVENQRWGNSFEPPTGGCGHPSVFIKSELWECWTSIVGGARIAFPCIKWHCNQCSKWKKILLCTSAKISCRYSYFFHTTLIYTAAMQEILTQCMAVQLQRTWDISAFNEMKNFKKTVMDFWASASLDWAEAQRSGSLRPFVRYRFCEHDVLKTILLQMDINCRWCKEMEITRSTLGIRRSKTKVTRLHSYI